MQFDNTLAFAKQLDKKDALASWRKAFLIPPHHHKNTYYFCGNSLGLQPKVTRAAIVAELDHWARYGVEGHFNGAMPWKDYHHFLTQAVANLVGALPTEVVTMNTLTTNLHLMMVSFYQPTSTRYKIIMEAGAFPSDQYAMESQARFHGLVPDDAIIEIHPREGEYTLHTEDIVECIKLHGDSVALVMFGGVNYYTGQFFDMASITKAAHAVGAYAGFDLAHAAGNVPMQLHDWDVDFAVWCSYKYLNAGPGGPSSAFVHQRHAERSDLPRFAGWWGHDEQRRFLMEKGFVPMKGAAGWQLSNAQIFSFAAYKASLDIFDSIGMAALRQKSELLSAYLHYWIGELNRQKPRFKVITPSDPQARGCQVSLLTGPEGRQLFDYLAENGVVCDWREPNVIRFAPVPLYNCFEDVYRLAKLMETF